MRTPGLFRGAQSEKARPKEHRALVGLAPVVATKASGRGAPSSTQGRAALRRCRRTRRAARHRFPVVLGQHQKRIGRYVSCPLGRRRHRLSRLRAKAASVRSCPAETSPKTGRACSDSQAVGARTEARFAGREMGTLCHQSVGTKTFVGLRTETPGGRSLCEAPGGARRLERNLKASSSHRTDSLVAAPLARAPLVAKRQDAARGSAREQARLDERP